MKKSIVVLVVFFAVLTTAAYAQEPGIVVSNKAGWHKIGEVKADFKTETESISVLGADKFKSIKLKITDAPINIQDMKVYYESGDVEDITVRSEIKAGGETRVIDLKGPARELKKVSFTYKTLPNADKDKAHVELFGLK